MTALYRIRVNYGLNAVGYIVRNDRGQVTFVAKNETPLGLEYITNNAAALRFALEDEENGARAVKIVRDALGQHGKAELLGTVDVAKEGCA